MRVGVLALLAGLFPQSGASVEPVTTAREWRESHERAILDEFVDILRIPNDGSDRLSMRRNAEAVARLFEKRGVQTRLLEASGGAPSVYGELLVPGAKQTLVFYAHYDGYPAGQKQWYTGDPFRPVLMSGPVDEGGQPIPLPQPGWPSDSQWRLYARSASDDKAAIVAMATALEALRRRKVPLQSNLKFFIEGGSESGSPQLAALLKGYRNLLSGNAWLLCDGRLHPRGQQQLIFGARGFAGLELTVYSGQHPAWGSNAAMHLAKLLSSMQDESGRVLVEGFYEGITPLGEADRQAIAEIPSADEWLMRDLGLTFADSANRKFADIMNDPFLNVRRISSGAAGAEAGDAIPSTATASIAIRLVKGMDHHTTIDRIVEHIRKQGFLVTENEPRDDVRLGPEKRCRVVRQPGYNAMRTPLDLDISKRVIAAVEVARGPVIKIPTVSASLPVAALQDMVHSPIIVVPIANYDNNVRAANENIRLQSLWEGIETMAALMGMAAAESGE
jgi:acetylornithine deacetylase/succinyl-diaminopimelate desuccinylase-like protein